MSAQEPQWQDDQQRDRQEEQGEQEELRDRQAEDAQEEQAGELAEPEARFPSDEEDETDEEMELDSSAAQN